MTGEPVRPWQSRATARACARRRPPTATLLLVLVLLSAACGARLTDEQRDFALTGPDQPAQLGEPAGEPLAEGAPPEEPAAEEDDEDQEAAPVADGQAPTPQGARDADDGQEPAADAQSAPDDAAQDDDEPDEQPVDTRAMPPEGNGGATDVGVTEDEIVLGNVSDISGAVPGLFESEQLAAQAYLEYFRQTEGTVYGREISYLPLDSQLSAGGNRAASIEACENAFANVGSMSAFDGGGAPVIEECGIPDLRAAAAEPAMQTVDNAHPIAIAQPDKLPLGEFEWVTENYPEATKRAAYLHTAADSAAAYTAKIREATARDLGWEWVYVQEIAVEETNFASFVHEMEERGVRYVAFQGQYQSATRLARAMRQQNFEPDIYHLDAASYVQQLLADGGEAIEGTVVTIMSVPVEEAEQHEELQLYRRALQQIAPGEEPTMLGMHSWSAAKLAVEVAKEVGPELTRGAFLEELRQVEDWDGGGVHPPADVGAQEPRSCFINVVVRDGRFQRLHPDSGFDCDGSVATGLGG